MFGSRLKTESETWGRTLKIRIVWKTDSRFFSSPSHALRACEARAHSPRKTLTARFTDFFTDFEENTDCFAVYRNTNEASVEKRRITSSFNVTSNTFD